VTPHNTVLLVDDDPDFMRLTRDLLAENGHEVLTAYSKAEALEQFERHRPGCVLLDIFLPDGSGVDLIKPFKSAAPATPVVMVSAQGDVGEVVRAMKDGADDYIKKPFRPEELLLKIQMVLDTAQARWELQELRSKARAEDEYKLLFSLSERMSKVQAIVDQVANTDITVLIAGESGTGKELVARAIHKTSDRAPHPFVKVNCAALPRELLESELFGFEKGAFTGAHRRKYGRFEMAQNGTIFLDEISEMPLDLQSKLLHVLQERQFYRIGGEREVRVNCRILAATNKNLDEMVDEGRFRRDLYYRINVVSVLLPPLRERKEDIPLLVDYFLGRYAEMYNREKARVSPRLMELFMEYPWPGNIRELENNIKRFVILGAESQLISELQRKREAELLQSASRGLVSAGHGGDGGARAAAREAAREGSDDGGDGEVIIPERATLKEVAKMAQRRAERVYIERVLQQTRWNRRKAAQILDISYKALLYKIKECGLDKE